MKAHIGVLYADGIDPDPDIELTCTLCDELLLFGADGDEVDLDEAINHVCKATEPEQPKEAAK